MDAAIRPGTDDDLPAVLDLWHEADAEPTHTDDLPSLQQLLRFDPEALLVAQAGDHIVGSVIAGWDGWRGSVYRLAVAPGYRRSGLAGRLVQAAVLRLEGAGAIRLQANVVADDDPAIGFWSSTEWERQVRRVRFVRG